MPEANDAPKQPERATLPTSCPPRPREEAECPKCASPMRLWANYYRCPNCGYKESCCF